jgi:hypothetical protein
MNSVLVLDDVIRAASRCREKYGAKLAVHRMRTITTGFAVQTLAGLPEVQHVLHRAVHILDAPYKKKSRVRDQTVEREKRRAKVIADAVEAKPRSPWVPQSVRYREEAILQRAARKGPLFLQQVQCGLHRLDLMRAGFREGHGELNVPREGVPFRSSPQVSMSMMGSSASMCADG